MLIFRIIYTFQAFLEQNSINLKKVLEMKNSPCIIVYIGAGT